VKLIVRTADIIGHTTASTGPVNLGDRVRVAGRHGVITHRNTDEYKVRLDGGLRTTWLTRDQISAT
jgi:hypothetical protein